MCGVDIKLQSLSIYWVTWNDLPSTYIFFSWIMNRNEFVFLLFFLTAVIVRCRIRLKCCVYFYHFHKIHNQIASYEIPVDCLFFFSLCLSFFFLFKVKRRHLSDSIRRRSLFCVGRIRVQFFKWISHNMRHIALNYTNFGTSVSIVLKQQFDKMMSY